MCVHTEKSLKVLDSNDDYKVKWEFEKRAVDKIIHAHGMVSVGTQERLRLVTISAHNYAEVWDFIENTPILRKR